MNILSLTTKALSAGSKPIATKKAYRAIPRLSDDSISFVLKTAAGVACESCRVVPDNVHCHLIRKTKAMDLYKNGMPLPFIMQFLGHESMSTTSGFYAFATLEMMSDAIKKAAPKMSEGDKIWKCDEIRKTFYSLD